MSVTAIAHPNRWFWTCIVGYCIVLSTALSVLPEDPTLAESAPFAVAAAVFGIGGLMAKTLETRGRADDLDRHILVETSSVAFFITMAGAVTWGLFEALADAPRLSAWATWTGGMGSWVIATLVAQRRLGR